MKKYKEVELLNICPTCGYDELFESPFDTYGYPSHEVCPCCGFEFGFDDSNNGYTYQKYLEEWMEKGFQWFSDQRGPKKWNRQIMLKQLKNIEKVSHYEPYI